MKALIRYVAVLFLFFIGLEVFVRANHNSFYALSDKLLLKIEMLKRRPNDQLVITGSSRTLDGIDAKTLEKTFKDDYQLDIKTFNNGSTGQNINRVLYILEQLLQMDDANTLLIESSQIGLPEGDLGIDLSGIPGREKKSGKSTSLENETPKKIEPQLAQFVSDNFYFVKTRKALKPKVFLRLIILWMSDVTQNDIWFRSGTLRQIFSGFYKKYDKEKFFPYSPVVIKPLGLQQNSVSKWGDTPIEKIAQLLQDSGKKVIFYNPPVSEEKSIDDCNPDRHELFQKISNRTQFVFIDYSCKGYPKKWLRDPTHLNPNGRIFFSQKLAHDLVQLLNSPPDAI